MIPITIPPLRARREDILPLARHFLAEANRMLHKSVQRFTPETEVLLVRYSWPGNVRELKSLVESMVRLSNGDSIDAHNMPPHLSQMPERPADAEAPTARTLAAIERSYILKVMQQTKGNKSEAARVLGIHRHSLRSRLRDDGIEIAGLARQERSLAAAVLGFRKPRSWLPLIGAVLVALAVIYFLVS